MVFFVLLNWYCNSCQFIAELYFDVSKQYMKQCWGKCYFVNPTFNKEALDCLKGDKCIESKPGLLNSIVMSSSIFLPSSPWCPPLLGNSIGTWISFWDSLLYNKTPIKMHRASVGTAAASVAWMTCLVSGVMCHYWPSPPDPLLYREIGLEEPAGVHNRFSSKRLSIRGILMSWSHAKLIVINICRKIRWGECV